PTLRWPVSAAKEVRVTRRRHLPVVVLAGAVSVWFGGVSLRHVEAQQTAPSPTIGVHTHVPGQAHADHEHAPLPAAYANAHIPPGAGPDPRMIAKGKEIYATKCALGQGEKGDGRGWGAATLPLKPADLTDAKMVAEMAGNYWFWRVSEGGLVDPFRSKGS